ncbi:MAG: DDE transposase, partial [Phormidesmis sp.]
MTNSIFAGRHQPLQTWIACLYLMGLNLSNQHLSNQQIAQELSLHKNDVHQMTSELRQAIADKRPEVQLSGTVEFDEVYVTAGHKGQPEQVKKKAARVGGANSKGFGVAVH